MENWTKSSWRNFPAKQQPVYEDLKELELVEKELSSYPPLIFAGEVENLKQKLANVTKRKAFFASRWRLCGKLF